MVFQLFIRFFLRLTAISLIYTSSLGYAADTGDQQFDAIKEIFRSQQRDFSRNAAEAMRTRRAAIDDVHRQIDTITTVPQSAPAKPNQALSPPSTPPPHTSNTITTTTVETFINGQRQSKNHSESSAQNNHSH